MNIVARRPFRGDQRSIYVTVLDDDNNFVAQHFVEGKLLRDGHEIEMGFGLQKLKPYGYYKLVVTKTRQFLKNDNDFHGLAKANFR